jgi:hypothetical protein
MALQVKDMNYAFPNRLALECLRYQHDLAQPSTTIMHALYGLLQFFDRSFLRWKLHACTASFATLGLWVAWTRPLSE